MHDFRSDLPFQFGYSTSATRFLRACPLVQFARIDFQSARDLGHALFALQAARGAPFCAVPQKQTKIQA